MERFVSLRQLHSIACKVVESKDQWGSDSKVLAIKVVAPGDVDYETKQGCEVSSNYFSKYVINVYALTSWHSDVIPEHIYFPGDRVLVITGSKLIPLDYMYLFCYGLSIVFDPVVLDVIDLRVHKPSTQEV